MPKPRELGFLHDSSHQSQDDAEDTMPHQVHLLPCFSGNEMSHTKKIQTSGVGLSPQIARFPGVGLCYSVLVNIMFTTVKINLIFSIAEQNENNFLI